MHNENGKTEGELFESLEVQVKQYKESDSTDFIQCFNRITDPKTVSINLTYEKDTEWTLSMRGNKESCFDDMIFKPQLVKLYKKQSSLFKAPFEEQKLNLATGIGEDAKEIIISMYLRKKSEQAQQQKESKEKEPNFENFFGNLLKEFAATNKNKQK
jgi:hypothetical protein